MGTISMSSKWSQTIYFSVIVFVILGTTNSQTIYPDGGRNVIKMLKAKPIRIIPYNDGSVMAHVIGSAGMNFLYYFHILGVSCENNDPEYYKIIQTDFEFCLNKTGPLPSEVRNRPLGSVPKSCYDWKIHKPCYKNLAEDYDECLAGRPGLVKKGTDALRFTHAYFLFVCGNVADTEAHLLDRYTKHDLLVPGVFQCFPKLQDRINNCVKRDKVSKTLCSKFFIVHACFGKYYNDDNCPDVQPIYYMDDLFRNMSKSLNCPKEENVWITDPTTPQIPPRGNKGWSSREEHSHKKNPWPGQVGRPWSSEKGSPFVRGDGIGWSKNEDRERHRGQHNHNSNHHSHSHSYNYNRDRNRNGWDSGSGSSERGWSSSSKGRHRDRDRLVSRPTYDPHAHRPVPDHSWNTKPYIDVLDRDQGRGSYGAPWERGRTQSQSPIQNSIDSGRGRIVTYVGRGPSRETPYVSSTPRGSSGERYSPYTSSGRPAKITYVTPTPRIGGYKKAALPPAGFAVTRIPQEEIERERDRDSDDRFFNTRDSDNTFTLSGEKLGDDGDLDNNNENDKYTFYAFE